MSGRFKHFDSISIGVFMLDKECNVVYWNLYMEEWLAVSSEEICSKPIGKFFPAFNSQGFTERLQDVFDFATPLTLSSNLNANLYSNVAGDECKLTFETTVTLYEDTDESYVLFNVRNVTDLKQKINSLNLLNIQSAKEIEKRRLAEEALAESEEKYRFLINYQSDLLVQGTLDGEILFLSPSYCTLLGLSQHDLLVKEKYESIIHPDDREALSKRFAEARLNPENGLFNHRVLSPKGIRHISWNYAIFKKNNTLNYIATGRDITTELQAQADKKRKREQQRILAEISQSFIVLDNIDEKINKAITLIAQHTNVPRLLVYHYNGENETAQLVNRYERDSAPQLKTGLETIDINDIKPLYEKLVKENYLRFDRIDEKQQDSFGGLPIDDVKSLLIFSIKIQNSFYGFITIARFTDKKLWTQDELYLFNTFRGILSSVIDRYTFNKKLRLSEEFHRTLFEKSFDAVMILKDNKFTDCNEAALSLFEYSNRDEFLDKQPWEISPEIQPDGARSFEKALSHISNANREGYVVFEWVHRKRTGQDFWAHISLSKMRIDNFDVFMVICHNISKRKEAEFQLKRASNEKSQFFSVLAHDLRNMIGSSMLTSDLINKLDEKEKVEEIKEFSQLLYEQSKRAYNLLESLLDWGRLTMENTDFTPHRVSLVSSVRKVMDTLTINAEEKNIQLSCNCTNSVFVTADENMLETVLRNLIYNAIKYTNAGGGICVSVKEKNQYAEIAISDNGIGMSEKTLISLFSFEDLKSQEGTNNEKGSGFGFVICKEMVAKHNGEIWAESELGQGTTIRFTIPIAKNIEID